MATHETILTFDPDDPRWTAYVLGELDGADRAELEALVEASADARRFVAELRQVAGLVGASLQAEPASHIGQTLTPPTAPRQLVERAKPAEPVISRRRQRTYQAVVALAASAILGGLFISTVQSDRSSGFRVDELERRRLLENGEAIHLTSKVESGTNLNGSTPNPADQAIVYPSTPDWKALTTRREKFAAGENLLPPAQMLSEPRPQESYAGTSSVDDLATKTYPVADLVLPIDTSASTSVPAGIVISGPEQKFGLKATNGVGGRVSSNGTPAYSPTITNYDVLAADQARNPQGSAYNRMITSSGREPVAPETTPATSPVNLNTATTISGGSLKLSDGAAKQSGNGTVTLGRGTYGLSTAPSEKEKAVFKVTDGKNTQSLEMAVTPRIVIQEEEEEQLGLVRRSTLDLAALANVAQAVTWDENGVITREFDNVVDNPFLPARDNPLSTFSVDVDTASYSIVRRFIAQDHRLPPKSAVRIEELINYFHYDYPQPTGETPVATTAEVVSCPWNAEHQLVRVAVKAREVPQKKRPPTNLVFLIDVSGSMDQPNKLPLVKQAMKLLLGQLTENDRVAIVVYAGNSGLVLPSVTGDQRAKIDEALDRLSAGGSTNGGEGIQLAYELALRNFVRGGANRVILATDGDFNVGVTDREALIKLIEEQAKSGVFLTALGFGMDNLKDGTLEQLADKGNGHYAFIDTFEEARKVFVDEINGTLVTVAKDVKIQIEFNPAAVGSYRLIGYENRALKAEDFNNDKKDAGDMGSGHTVTALYEIAPVGAPIGTAPVDPLKYQSPPIKLTLADAATSDELMTLKLRYKEPDAQTSKLIEVPVKRSNLEIEKASADLKFAAAVASFGMTLRDSPYKGRATIDSAIKLAEAGQGTDASGYRAQFIELLKQAKSHLPAVKPE